MYSMDESSSSDSKYSYSSTSESESSDASSGSDSEYSYSSTSGSSESDTESEDEFYSCDEAVIVMDEVPESTKDLMVFPKMQSKEQKKQYKSLSLN